MLICVVVSLIRFSFFWLIPSFTRFLSITLSFIDFDPTMKFSSSDVHRVGMANNQHESFMDVGQSVSLLVLTIFLHECM